MTEKKPKNISWISFTNNKGHLTEGWLVRCYFKGTVATRLFQTKVLGSSDRALRRAEKLRDEWLRLRDYCFEKQLPREVFLDRANRLKKRF